MEHDQRPNIDWPTRHPAWNKGKLVGAKPPLQPSHVWSIRTKLQMQGRIRDLALFNLAIDSKLRGCDVVASASKTLQIGVCFHRTKKQDTTGDEDKPAKLV